MAQTIKINGRVIEKCAPCVKNYYTVDASLIARYTKYLERKFKCKGCLANVKRKYEDADRKNFCVRCTTGTSRSRLDLYSTDTEDWPSGHIEDIDRSPVVPNEEIQEAQEERDRERWNKGPTVSIDEDELSELIKKHDRIRETQANARNKQISKRMWGR